MSTPHEDAVSPITYRSPLQWAHEDGTPLEADTIVTFDMGNAGMIEFRHKGDYIEVHRTGGNHLLRLTIEPRVSNEIWIRLER